MRVLKWEEINLLPRGFKSPFEGKRGEAESIVIFGPSLANDAKVI